MATPIQQYNYDNLDYYQNKSLSDFDTYGGYSQTNFPGVSTAAMMDPDVAGYFNQEYQIGNSIPASIQQKIANMENIYKASGWDGVLQNAKNYWVDLGKQGVVNADNNPNKKLSTGAWTWEDTLGALSVLAIPVGGALMAGAGAGAGAAGAAGAETAGAAGLGSVAAGGAATGGAATGAGLAGTLGLDAAIPTVTVTGAAGGTAAGGGLGSIASGLTGLGSLASTLGGNSPNITNPTTGNGDITAPDGVPASGGGLGDYASTIKSVGQLGSSINDLINGNKTASSLNNYMSSLNSMYAPGSPEAKLMEQQLAAKDAAAGRNSQYGVRAQNLAAMLTQARAGILTNNNYFGALTGANNADRNKFNSIFSTLGNAENAYKGLSSLASLFS